ncbi:hypothetical protein GQ44DRAFT_741267 [Phaeosphaeriaceae sp. PMI808]|nr:hypothetical protein GQ44DRAFT_741267 [Phaeosphaeriaceae sp. PMI808]
MLSTISHSMPPSYTPSPGLAPNMTTMASSLPIISRQQRPKLSVNTSQPRSFGKGKGASLRLDTLSAVSPTNINTFSNAYPASTLASTSTSTSISTSTSVSTSTSTSTSTPSSTPIIPSPTSALSSTLTSASNESATTCIPYKQPHNLASILINSPARSIIPRKMASSRPMFPAEKHVSFRTPLEEEITTIKYTLAHSDLDSSISTLSSLASTSDSDSNSNSDKPSSLSVHSTPDSTVSTFSSPRPKQPRTGDKRDSSSSEDESDTCPATPVAGRRKRTRDWRWTLGTIPGPNKSASSSTSDATTSEDST